MDLPEAIDEFVGMLMLGSDALLKLARNKTAADATVKGPLDDIRSAAERLSAAAEKLRDRPHSQ